MIKAILFDLDGTLLPMDQDIFVKAYFGGLVKAIAPHGYDPEKLVESIWAGTKSMIKNDGSMTNESAFWKTFTAIFGEEARNDEPYFEKFYESGFDKVREVLGYNEKAKEVVQAIKAMGYRVALATNPVFPSIATEKRIKWAGLSPSDFELFTTYENSSFCKPNIAYYEEIIKKLGIKAEECLMVGNDVTDDMIAEELGMKVFLLTDCLINKSGRSLSDFPRGDFEALMSFLKGL